MPFEPSPRVNELQRQLQDFMAAHVYPNEARYFDEAEKLGPWSVLPVVEADQPGRVTGLLRLHDLVQAGFSRSGP